MSSSAGWYQDTERPDGHLRYWDGQQWTEFRVAAPAGTLSTASSSPTAAWVGSHKILTTVMVLLALALVGSWLPSNDPEETSAASAEPSDTADVSDSDADSTASSQTASSKPHAKRKVADRGRSSGAGRADADPSKPRAKPKPPGPTFYVARIVDGDTIELGNGETVRLVGIDTPEVGECGFEEAAANLSDLVLGKRVRLGTSDEDRDSYGRLLRYVDLRDMDAGLRLIKNGRAIAAYDSRDGYGFHPRETVYIASDRGSRNLCRMQTGQQAPPSPPPQPQPLVGGNGNAGGNCAAGYSPCLPSGPDLDCADVNGPVRVTGSDPYQLDADGDGLGCDS